MARGKGYGYRHTSRELYHEFGTEWRYDWAGHRMLETFFSKDLNGYERERVYEGLKSYMEHEYGLDFEEWLDWDAYREWYDSTAS